jgi:hypothetical protein
MRRLLIATAALSMVVCFGKVASAADEVKGVLIDQTCGSKQMSKADPEKSAADHPKSCAMKDSCAKSGYAVISGKKMYKFDEKGTQLAKDYLKDHDSTKVVVKGTEKGDEIQVTSITAAP